jgi:hypothetical protein
VPPHAATDGGSHYRCRWLRLIRRTRGLLPISGSYLGIGLDAYSNFEYQSFGSPECFVSRTIFVAR